LKQKSVHPGLVVFLAVALASFSVRAQRPPDQAPEGVQASQGPAEPAPLTVPSPEKVRALQDVADRVSDALRRGDVDMANRLASDLMLSLFHEMKPPGPARAYSAAWLAALQDLANLVRSSVQRGDLDMANRLASTLMLSIFNGLKSPPPVTDLSDEELQDLDGLVGQVKTALQRNDLGTANRAAGQLMHRTFAKRNAHEPLRQANPRNP
jgi:hypothetical protein